jgi:hypothetical protein
MKTRSNSIKLLVLTALIASVVSIFFGTQRTKALNPQPLPPGEFGMVGFTSGQTFRLNAVNAFPHNPDMPTTSSQGSSSDSSAGPSVQVTLTFLDSNGNPLLNGGGHPIQSTMTLGPGQSTFLDLNADTMPVGPPSCQSGCVNAPGPNGRLELRPRVTAILTNPQKGDDDDKVRNPIISSLELFDNNSGRTSMLIRDWSGPGDRNQ